jgi:cytoskeletal protein RodZ
MSDLGQWLREAREARGLSLAEVEEATRIRQHFLSALEADEWSSLPSEAVGRGFLRNYALFLGLSADDFIAQRVAEQAPAERAEILTEQRPLDYRPIEFDLKVDGEALPWLRWGLAGLVVLILGISGWWLFAAYPDILAALGPEPTATPTTQPIAEPTLLPPPTATPTQPAPTPTAGVFLLPTPTLLPQPTQTPTLTITSTLPIPGIHVKTKITERTWLRVAVDGQVQLETIIEPGDDREWVAQQSLTIRSGNAGGISVILDGQDLGVMGQPGQVVERAWAWVDGRVIEQEPTVTAEGGNTGGGVELITPLTPTPVPTATPAG